MEPVPSLAVAGQDRARGVMSADHVQGRTGHGSCLQIMYRVTISRHSVSKIHIPLLEAQGLLGEASSPPLLLDSDLVSTQHQLGFSSGLQCGKYVTSARGPSKALQGHSWLRGLENGGAMHL